MQTRRPWRGAPGLLILAIVLLSAVGPAPPPVQAGTSDPVITAAGDIAPPATAGHHKATSDRVLAINPTVALTLGDAQYPSGALADFQRYYHLTWGRFKAKTRPTPGNHEYRTSGAAGYFSYFGTAAKPVGQSYYSFNLGGWHLIALNSNIARGVGSAQERWLKADLAATSKRCILGYWHHPRFSSGTHHGHNTSVGPLWTALYAARADVVLNGHEHNYERFALQSPSAQATSQGIREFVVGTGGNGLYGFGTPKPNSQFRNSTTFGVLKLVLHASSYEWWFISESGAVIDRGGPTACH
jgi:Calcineurin-like phosphoesterase